ncbi:MAG: hypothetical protein J0L62_01350 [Bacteroidetes bacterium]|nr:hypothetical protein [Bacteroidota bacterium]
MRPILWLLLFILVGLSGGMIAELPIASYWVSWSTSVFIYLFTVTGVLIEIPKDLPILRQLFRPYFLGFTFFSGYVPLSTIFYFLSLFGYEFFTQTNDQSPSLVELNLVVSAQWYYLIAQVFYVIGMAAWKWKTENRKYNLPTVAVSDIFLVFFLLIQVLVFLSVLIPGFAQVAVKLSSISQILGVLFLGVSIEEGKRTKILIGTGLVIYSFLIALFSGMKSAPLLVAILLSTFLIYRYPRTITFFSLAAFFIWVTYIPYYNGTYRDLAWGQFVDPIEANQIAREETLNASPQALQNASWAMLVDRLSEVNMFIKFSGNVPQNRPYYGMEILSQVFIGIIPRVFWPEKPDMEILIMTRVYENGVVVETSDVSAKPSYVADSYLTGGWPVIIIAHFLLGFFNIWLANKAENWFGGYLFGSGVIFNGLFSIAWLGNSFEFLVNSMFWSFVVMAALRLGFIWAGVLRPNRTESDT